MRGRRAVLWGALVAALCVAGCDERPTEEPENSGDDRVEEETRVLPDGGVEVVIGGDAIAIDGPLPPEGCFEPPPEDDPSLPAAERDARTKYACAWISLKGRVLTRAGAPVGGATVRVHGQTAKTGADGGFFFPGLPRRNALLEVELSGFHKTIEPVHLRRGLEEAEVVLNEVFLSEESPEIARFVFTGDVMMGRRFLDPDNATPRDALPADNPDAVIQTSDPLPGSREVLRWVRPFLESADFAAVNLECPVTDEPATPHPYKSYVFFTLPKSLEAIVEAGVDYVSLGNNHVHDYLDDGLVDTLGHLDRVGLPYSGAGVEADAAFKPSRVEVGGTGYSLLSMSSVGEGTADEWDLLASDTTGGAANLLDEARVSAALKTERDAGRVPIALLHTGAEYSERPADYTKSGLQRVVRDGAALVIAHHPHVPQGLSWDGDVLVAQSLGNFVFDQDRHDTMLGLVAEIGMKGATVAQADVMPVYLKRYRTLPIAGALADSELRRLAALSREGELTLVPNGARGVVLPRGEAGHVQTRTVDVNVTVNTWGMAVLDVRPLLRPGESLASAELTSTGEGSLAAGRDIFLYGDFEDYDVDDLHNDAYMWELPPEEAHVCQRGARRGAAGLCLTSRSSGGSMADFDERVRIPVDASGRANRWLTLVGWARGVGAGTARVEVRYEPALGGGTFGDEHVFEHGRGDYDWTYFADDLSLPKEPSSPNDWNSARALRLFAFQSSTSEEGLFALDDLAVVAWETVAEDGPLVLQTPHARDFVRVEAPAGEHTVRLTFRSHSAIPR